MQNRISRRAVVKGGLIAGALIPAMGLMTSSADAAANATFKAGQKCSTCAQFQGKATDATAGCNIFAGKSVPAGGWCKVWAAKPA